MVIAATTLGGMVYAGSLKEQYRQIRYLQRLMYMIESEIRYAHAHLGEIFLHVSRRVQEPYKGWLLAMRRKMGQLDSGAFDGEYRSQYHVPLQLCGRA